MTVTKAELRKKYLEKTGLTKLPKEIKSQFTSAVNTAYFNYISAKTNESTNNEIKEDSEAEMLVTDSSSEDEITSANIKENIIADKFENEVNDMQEEQSSDSDGKFLASYKKNGIKKLSNAVKKQRSKRTLSSSSEDEIVQSKSVQRNKILKKNRRYSDLDDEPLPVFQKQSKSVGASLNSKTKSEESENECHLKYVSKQSNNPIDSGNEPVKYLTKKKANSFNDSTNHSSDSDDEPLTRFQKLNKYNSDMEFKKNSSDSETEPLAKYKECNDYTHSDADSNSFSKKKLNSSKKFCKLIDSTSESEDEPVLTLTHKKSKSLNKSHVSRYSSSESENESLSKYSKKKAIISDDSDKEPLKVLDSKDKSLNKNNRSSRKKPITNNNSRSKEKNLKKKRFVESDGDAVMSNQKEEYFGQSNSLISDTDEDEPLSNMKNKEPKSNLLNESCILKNSSESEIESPAKYSKKKTGDFLDSDEELDPTLNKKSNIMNNSLKSTKYLSDSEDEPLNNLSNKKISNSSYSGKKPVTSRNSRSKENILKKRRFVGSDDDDAVMSNQKKEEYFDGQRNSLISDTSEDEPLSNMKNKEPKSNLLNESCILKNSSGSEIESSAKISKKRTSDSLDSDEELDTTLTKKSNIMNNSLKSMKYLSDSEDEPLNNLNNKKTGHSSESEKESDEKIVKKKRKNYFKKPVTNRVKPKEQILQKKKVIDSDDDISISSQKQEKCFDSLKNSLSNSSEDESFSEVENCNDSEDEPLNRLSAQKSNKKRKSSESGSCSFADENEEHPNKKDKPSKKRGTNDANKGKKHTSASENKIEHLKKYLRVAGIRISNYNKLFANCKTMKAKCEKLLSLLEKEGLKGRPTLEKCKKLRIKIETKREIAELDISNILKVEGGRPKRSICSDTTNCKSKEENSTPIKKFSRLQDIVDSEESD